MALYAVFTEQKYFNLHFQMDLILLWVIQGGEIGPQSYTVTKYFYFTVVFVDNSRKS